MASKSAKKSKIRYTFAVNGTKKKHYQEYRVVAATLYEAVDILKKAHPKLNPNSVYTEKLDYSIDVE